MRRITRSFSTRRPTAGAIAQPTKKTTNAATKLGIKLIKSSHNSWRELRIASPQTVRAIGLLVAEVLPACAKYVEGICTTHLLSQGIEGLNCYLQCSRMGL